MSLVYIVYAISFNLQASDIGEAHNLVPATEDSWTVLVHAIWDTVNSDSALKKSWLSFEEGWSCNMNHPSALQTNVTRIMQYGHGLQLSSTIRKALRTSKMKSYLPTLVVEHRETYLSSCNVYNSRNSPWNG
jgi:hypothetical protein